LEFARYDLIVRCQGSGRVLRQLCRDGPARKGLIADPKEFAAGTTGLSSARVLSDNQ
jgi:hypothetical protein